MNPENQDRKLRLWIWKKTFGFGAFLGQSEINKMGIKHDFCKNYFFEPV